MDVGVDVVLLEYFEETRDIEQFTLDGNDVGAWRAPERHGGAPSLESFWTAAGRAPR